MIWLATRDRTRSAAAHRRSARAVLAKLNIPTSCLRGTWLVLATEEAVRAAVEQTDPVQSSCAATGDRHHQETRTAAPSAANEDDVKVIQLGRNGGAGTLIFEVVR